MVSEVTWVKPESYVSDETENNTQGLTASDETESNTQNLTASDKAVDHAQRLTASGDTTSGAKTGTKTDDIEKSVQRGTASDETDDNVQMGTTSDEIEDSAQIVATSDVPASTPSRDTANPQASQSQSVCESDLKNLSHYQSSISVIFLPKFYYLLFPFYHKTFRVTVRNSSSLSCDDSRYPTAGCDVIACTGCVTER